MKKKSVPSKKKPPLIKNSSTIENLHSRQVKTLVGRLRNTALSGHTIVRECKKIPGIGFKGVYMQNQQNIPTTGCLIMNNDLTGNPGIHWLAIVFKGKTIYVYDSFGRRSRNILPIYTQQMKAKGFRIVNTDLSDQDQYGNTTVTCGHRCISSLKIYKKYGIKGFKQL